jgi:hypothetical protein
MSSALPVLTTLKSDWNSISEAPILGKDVLELLSSSMYVNPLSIYREYIQNATDSIEEAVSLGYLPRTSEGTVEISVDSQRRTIRIRDNGTGVPEREFVRRLIALGASRKRGHKARGFRGVGRLAGLGYCQELVFRSRAEGERHINELRWDCRKLKEILRDPQFSEQLGELIRDVVRYRKSVDVNYPERFFEVELVNVVRHGADKLMNASLVSNYLSQVAPVPLAPDFTFAEKIETALSKYVMMGNISISINDSLPIYRPHRNSFVARKGHEDSFADVEIIEILGNNAKVSAIGWIAHHSYYGAISEEAKLPGLRLRCGNVQVGESNLLNDLFQEPRFNSWTVGEVHVLDERILPNGRRDDFEQSVPFNDLLGHLGALTARITKLCRQSSIQRNRAKRVEGLFLSIENALSILEQHTVTRMNWGAMKVNSLSKFNELTKLLAREESEAHEEDWTTRLKKLQKRIDTLGERPRAPRSLVLTNRERKIFDALYEALPSQSAKQIVDQILSKIR